METIMDDICGYLHNYFVDEIHEGTYIIEGKTVTLPFLKSGQYFYVSGSTFNDGVWKYPATNMTNEEFDGEIWAMKVPASLVALSAEISAWITKYADAGMDSPFSSESFNNYSYTRAQGASSDGSYAPVTWQNIFAARLARWRKLP